MDGKTALITGISGQDGAYLAEHLLVRGYSVHGLTRHVSTLSTGRIAALCNAPVGAEGRLRLHLGDLCDGPSLSRLLQEVRPDELYNLGAQSNVAVSFAVPEYTFDCNALGTLRLLEAIRALDMVGHVRFYQASTSELFGDAADTPQDESTPFRPRSPYAVSKLAAHWQVVNYRQAYGLFACCGILFNHESPRRGESFVSRRISLGLARVHAGLQDCITLGNLEARRDWGHAIDYVRAQWLMLQQAQPDDYVIATGEQHSVREFTETAAAELGMQLAWEGEGTDELARVVGVDDGTSVRPGQVVVRVAAENLRANDVQRLQGDASKARRVLGWTPSVRFDALVREMVAGDRALVAGAHNQRG